MHTLVCVRCGTGLPLAGCAVPGPGGRRRCCSRAGVVCIGRLAPASERADVLAAASLSPCSISVPSPSLSLSPSLLLSLSLPPFLLLSLSLPPFFPLPPSLLRLAFDRCNTGNARTNRVQGLRGALGADQRGLAEPSHSTCSQRTLPSPFDRPRPRRWPSQSLSLLLYDVGKSSENFEK